MGFMGQRNHARRGNPISRERPPSGTCRHSNPETKWPTLTKSPRRKNPRRRIVHPRLVLALPSHPRTPIKRGQIYRFKGYPGAGFKIQFVALPGHEEDDGGLSGVAVKWLNLRRQSMFYPFSSEADFWACDLFRNACDPEFA